mgnify:CR=1 FL=1
MKKTILVLVITALGACTSANQTENIDSYSGVYASSYFFNKVRQDTRPHTRVAFQFLNYNEQTHRQELKAFTGVDPVRTEWCAAFVNAVLNESGVPGSESVSNYPLTARSFLRWGHSVDTPQPGDLVVFPRGNASWQGHVGFYFGSRIIGGVEYYRILGGNQNNEVSIELYPASRALDIRRENPI